MNNNFSLIGIEFLENVSLDDNPNITLKKLVDRINYIHKHLEEKETIERFRENSPEHMVFKRKAGIEN